VSSRVVALAVTPVKGLRVLAREQVEIGPWGVRENRRFFLLDADDQMVNGKRFGSLQELIADYCDAERTLAMSFPDGSLVSAPIESGRRLAARFFSTTVAAVEVRGPWSDALSDHVGAPLRLVESVGDWGAVDRGREGPVSLISSASIERVAQAAQAPAPVDARRFRMLVEVDGTEAHEEDEWLGRPLAIGAAVVTLQGHVGRCVVTKRDPDSGVVDLDTLGALASYRRDADTTEQLGCGVYGTVLQSGTVRLGDPVELS
jgi:uncharacterized protein YcbX